MLQKSFAAALLIFFCSTFSSAQYVPSSDEYSLKMDDQKKPAKKKKKKDFNTIAPNIIDLGFFLPDANNSWALSLTSSGGFAGVTRLIAAVNSNGNFLCKSEQEFRNRLLEKVVLDEIFDFVETTDFSKFNTNDKKSVDYCMDCAYTMLTLQTQDGFATRTLNVYANETTEVKRIYDRLTDLEECR